MAAPSWWVSTAEMFQGREGRPFSSSGEREYTRIYQVRVKSAAVDSVMVCLFSPGIPAPYEPYTNPTSDVVDWLAIATDISAKPQDDDDWQVWIVTVKYSTNKVRPGAGTSGNPKHPESNKPEDEEPEVSWDSETFQIALSEDLDGTTILNAAGDPFVPSPMEEATCPVLTVTRNEGTWTATDQMKWSNVVNTDKFLNWTPGQALMKPPKAQKKWKGGYKYWRVTYKVVGINFMEKGKTTWQTRLLNAGYRELKLVQTSPLVFKLLPIAAFDASGHKVTHPVLLDKNGVQVQPNAQGKKVAEWLTFRTRQDQAFAPLKLDQFI